MGQWVHFVLTLSNSSVLTFYQNGTALSTKTSTYALRTLLRTNNYIGRARGATSRLRLAAPVWR